MNLDGLNKSMKDRFQTGERARAFLRDWETTSLTSIMSKNNGKLPSVCLDILIDKLSEIKVSIPLEYRNDTIMKKRLLKAVKDVDACKLAYQKPLDSLQGIMYDLHAYVATIHNNNIAITTAHFVDRQFRNSRDQKKKKYCYVCKKEGCWSKKHSTAEKLSAFKKNKNIRQFFTDVMDGSDYNSDEEEKELVEQLEDVCNQIISVKGEYNEAGCDEMGRDVTANGEEGKNYLLSLEKFGSLPLFIISLVQYTITVGIQAMCSLISWLIMGLQEEVAVEKDST